MKLVQQQKPAKPAITPSSYSLHSADSTAGIEDIIPSPRTTLMCGSNKDQRGCYLAIPTTGIPICYTRKSEIIPCVFRCVVSVCVCVRTNIAHSHPIKNTHTLTFRIYFLEHKHSHTTVLVHLYIATPNYYYLLSRTYVYSSGKIRIHVE